MSSPRVIPVATKLHDESHTQDYPTIPSSLLITMPSLHLNSERVRYSEMINLLVEQAGGYKISNHVRIEFPLSEEKSMYDSKNEHI
jgi:hypothetical protein